MTTEQELIPYHISNLPPSPWLILSPHPDDETIGMGGTIILGAQKGTKIWEVVITDGSKGGDINVRKKETKDVAKFLGIEKVIWWNITDREVKKNYDIFFLNLPNILDTLLPKTIFLPSPMEFHPDHRHTTFATMQYLKKSNYKSKIWLYEISRQGEVNKLIDITDVVLKKEKAIKLYRSQVKERPYHEIALSLNRIRSYTLPNNIKYAEGFFEISKNTNLEDIKKHLHTYTCYQPDNSPLVSVIVRTKNRPQLLGEALESIANQTYKYIEAVVVNDGGDDVADVVYSFKGKIYKVKYIEHRENKGRSAAANSGILNAEGEWLTLLDDDDVLLPDGISILVQNSKVTEAVYGMVDAILYKYDESQDIISTFGFPFSREALFINNYIPTCGFLFKKTLALKIGGFDEEFDRLEDWDFIFRLSRETDFIFLPKKVAQYRLFNRGYVVDIQDVEDALWREKFYKKHFNIITPRFLTKGFFDTINIQKKNIKHLEEKIHNLNHLVKDNEKLQNIIKQLIQEKEKLAHHLNAVSQENKKLYDKINTLSKEKEKLAHDLNTVSQENKKLAETINDVFSSTSWKITDPLRRIGLFIRHVKIFLLSRKKNRYRCSAVSITKSQLDKILSDLSYKPLISIIIPVYNTPAKFLKECLDSALSQYYPYIEICIADDASTDPKVKEILRQYSDEYPDKIKILYREENGHISTASNSALSLATGEFVAFLDHDDIISQDALLEIVKLLNKHPDADLIYTDEDKIDEKGRHKLPLFKPDWSPDLLECQNYICHFLVVRRKFLQEKNIYFRSGFEGAQDYDLILRITELTDKIFHIPKVLYSWREYSHSTSINIDAKPYARKSGLIALKEHITRKKDKLKNLQVKVKDLEDLRYDIMYLPKDNSLVSIIIPTKDNVTLLKRCIDSILQKSTYDNFEIIIIDNLSKEEETRQYLQELSNQHTQIKIINANYNFNWSKINNQGIMEASGEVLIFLNNDTEVITQDWIERLAGDCLREEIGIVGPLLLYEDNTIQHAGVVVGIGGWADELYKGAKPIHFGSPFISPMVKRNVLAVTGACMAISKKTIEKIGLFSEEFIICGSDVEICIRAYKAGLYNIYNPFVKLYHFESKTRDRKKIPKSDFDMSYKVYRNFLEHGDPFYNVNLSLEYNIPRAKI